MALVSHDMEEFSVVVIHQDPDRIAKTPIPSILVSHDHQFLTLSNNAKRGQQANNSLQNESGLSREL
jgi:hypothetical protein